MIYAIKNNNRIKATPKLKDAICPFCNDNLISACGKINIWHFRHKSKNCDLWKEKITEWHLKWQLEFSPDNMEVRINKNGKYHVADILTDNNTVIEFQHSPISPHEIAEREKFYGKMVWVFDLIKSVNNIYFKGLDKIGNDNVIEYLFLYAKKHIYYCKKPVFIDIGNLQLYWINFKVKGLPKFRQTESYSDTNEAGHEYWQSETHYNYQPCKVVSKIEFLNYFK